MSLARAASDKVSDLHIAGEVAHIRPPERVSNSRASPAFVRNRDRLYVGDSRFMFPLRVGSL